MITQKDDTDWKLYIESSVTLFSKNLLCKSATWRGPLGKSRVLIMDCLLLNLLIFLYSMLTNQPNSDAVIDWFMAARSDWKNAAEQ